jgi:DNA-binding protein Fis
LLSLSPAAARSFVKQQRESYLERQFKRLQYTEAVRVYGVATEQEKPLLNRLLREKRQNLIRRHATIPTATD